jgi:quercetin dioxygenase-like cupin family protein
VSVYREEESMSRYALRLLEDRLQAAASPASLSAENRVIYVVDGEVAITTGRNVVSIGTNTAWYGAGPGDVTCIGMSAQVWRWELVRLPVEHDGFLAAEAVVSTEKLSQEIELEPEGRYLMRCDRVDFSAGQITGTHTHPGPGIRCLLFGEFRVHLQDKETLVHSGQAWFERGPDPVYAVASESEATAFVRVMILPKEFKGKRTIRLVSPQDEDKKSQKYAIFLDEEINI